MALTDYQRGILALLATHRIERQESYLAGGAALTVATESPRLSRGIDLFHDTREALLSTWEEDHRILAAGGYSIEVRRQYPTFVEAAVRKGGSAVIVQWAVNSAFRFFPLVRDVSALPSLHPFDLATNKTLALIGRVEPRDWIDLIACHDRIQPIGLLCWAASGKDPGTNPTLIVSEAGRSARYTQVEIDGLSFEEHPPDTASLSVRWKAMLSEARTIIAALPTEEVGTCVLDAKGKLFRGDQVQIGTALAGGMLRFHRGTIRGSIPRFIEI
ncbi:MAG: nucleotidyl transferase AbiEii/AbiGii toxin family protein [Spirochaetia bacterium]|jgi:hypothetical protein